MSCGPEHMSELITYSNITIATENHKVYQTHQIQTEWCHTDHQQKSPNPITAPENRLYHPSQKSNEDFSVKSWRHAGAQKAESWLSSTMLKSCFITAENKNLKHKSLRNLKYPHPTDSASSIYQCSAQKDVLWLLQASISGLGPSTQTLDNNHQISSLYWGNKGSVCCDRCSDGACSPEQKESPTLLELLAAPETNLINTAEWKHWEAAASLSRFDFFCMFNSIIFSSKILKLLNFVIKHEEMTNITHKEDPLTILNLIRLLTKPG